MSALSEMVTKIQEVEDQLLQEYLPKFRICTGTHMNLTVQPENLVIRCGDFSEIRIDANFLKLDPTAVYLLNRAAAHLASFERCVHYA